MQGIGYYNGTVVAALVVLVVILRMIVVYRNYMRLVGLRRRDTFILVILGPYTSYTKPLVEYLHEVIPSSQDPLLRVSWEDIYDRLPSNALPGPFVKKAGSVGSGDSVFNVMTFSKQPDGSMDMTLSSKGKRLHQCVHESWRSLASGGCNMIIEYVTGNEWSLKDFFGSFKDFGGRVVLIELKYQLGQLSAFAGDIRRFGRGYIPDGFILSSFKLSRNLPQIPSRFTRLQVDVPFGIGTAELNERIAARIRLTGAI